jgi:Domain of unknown function (DUF4823)
LIAPLGRKRRGRWEGLGSARRRLGGTDQIERSMKTRFVLWLTLGAGLLALACSSEQMQVNASWRPGRGFDASGGTLIAVSADAVQPGVGVATGSGMALDSVLISAFAQYGVHAQMGTADKDPLAEARSQGLKYALRATFTEWEQHSTEWSAIPVSVGATAELFDVSTGYQIATATGRFQSTNATFVHFTVREYLPRVADAIVRRLAETAGAITAEPPSSSPPAGSTMGTAPAEGAQRIALLPGAASVVITRNAMDVASCAEKGRLELGGGEGVEWTPQDVENDARNRAVAMGGNVVFLPAGSQTAVAYACQPR